LQHLYLHSEDLDGWLAHPNEPLLPIYRECFAELEDLQVEADDGVHELRIVLNSGKAPGYLEAQARSFGGRFVIACNGAAWREVGGATRLFSPPTPDFATLRRLLGIGVGTVGVVELGLTGRPEVVIEEGKRWEGRDLVLTLFTEPEPVRHRWQFRGGTDRDALRGVLQALIREHGLALAVLEPHGDGALDVVPVAAGRAVGKWTLPVLARKMFPDALLHLTHGGDGAGDLPAMEAEEVTPLSAANCESTSPTASARGGVVASRRAPEGGAVLECYAALAKRGFYGPLSNKVAAIIERLWPERG
jgi:hypothetical protein